MALENDIFAFEDFEYNPTERITYYYNVTLLTNLSSIKHTEGNGSTYYRGKQFASARIDHDQGLLYFYDNSGKCSNIFKLKLYAVNTDNNTHPTVYRSTEV